MAYSYNDYSSPANGFSVVLDYVATNDIYVTITTGDTITELTSSQFTVAETSVGTAFTVTLNTEALALVTGTSTVRVGRSTSITSATRSFSDGSVLKASDLNTQNKQFLLTIQESLDNANTALPIGTDNKFNAGGRIIKNLETGSNENDAVTKQYVDALALFGGANAAIEPQSWEVSVAGAGTNQTWTGSADWEYILTAPTPAGAADNMYLVYVGGVLQSPSQYSVVDANSQFTITIPGAGQSGSATVAEGTLITIRNFGATRNSLITPFESDSVTHVTLPLNGIANQTADYIQIKDSSAVEKFAVDVDGAITIGGAVVDDVNTTLVSKDSIELGDVAVSNHLKYGASLTKAAGAAKLDLQASETASSAVTDTAIQATFGLSNGSLTTPFKLTYDGNVILSGGITAATGAIQASSITAATATITSAITAGTTVNVGTISGSEYPVTLQEAGIKTTKNIDLREAFSQSCITTTSSSSTVGSGLIGFNSNGNIRIGRGGSGTSSGTSVSFGGYGSMSFDNSGNEQLGPNITVDANQIAFGGFKVINTQGGSATNTTTPATARYTVDGAADLVWSSLGSNDLTCKKHVESYVSPKPIMVWQLGTYTAQNQSPNVAPFQFGSVTYSRNTGTPGTSLSSFEFSNTDANNVGPGGPSSLGVIRVGIAANSNPGVGASNDYGTTITLKDSPDASSSRGEYCWKLTAKGNQVDLAVLKWQTYADPNWVDLSNSQVRSSGGNLTEVIAYLDMDGKDQEKVRLAAYGASNSWSLTNCEVTVEVL